MPENNMRKIEWLSEKVKKAIENVNPRFYGGKVQEYELYEWEITPNGLPRTFGEKTYTVKLVREISEKGPVIMRGPSSLERLEGLIYQKLGMESMEGTHATYKEGNHILEIKEKFDLDSFLRSKGIKKI